MCHLDRCSVCCYCCFLLFCVLDEIHGGLVCWLVLFFGLIQIWLYFYISVRENSGYFLSLGEQTAGFDEALSCVGLVLITAHTCPTLVLIFSVILAKPLLARRGRRSGGIFYSR